MRAWVTSMSQVKLNKAGLKIGFVGQRNVLHASEITLKKLNKRTRNAKLS